MLKSMTESHQRRTEGEIFLHQATPQMKGWVPHSPFLIMARLWCTLLVCTCLWMAVTADKAVMPWMGLEWVGEDIETDMKTLSDHAHDGTITHVSFEDWHLGADSTVVHDDDVTSVRTQLQEMGYFTFPMFTSVTPEYMRAAFENPQPVIDALVKYGTTYKYTGYNLDWEPNKAMTADDGQNFCTFLTKLADGLHDAGLKLNVDVASWDDLWDFECLGKTHVDTVITMDTYVHSMDTWNTLFSKALKNIPLEKLGIGLITTYSGRNMTADELKPRFDAIKAADVQMIGIWDMPLGDAFWPLLEDFVATKSSQGYNYVPNVSGKVVPPRVGNLQGVAKGQL